MTNSPTHVLLAGTDFEICRWIWRHLVPPGGAASTIQGELLRAIERLRTEAQDNGNVNWDEQYALFVAYLEQHLAGEAGFSLAVRREIRTDLARLRVDDSGQEGDALSEENSPYVDDDLYDRISGHIVSYCRLHPALVPHVRDPRQDR